MNKKRKFDEIGGEKPPAKKRKCKKDDSNKDKKGVVANKFAKYSKNHKNIGFDFNSVYTKEIIDCVKSGHCSFNITGANYSIQVGHHCITCGLTNENRKCICEACKDICHSGHEIVLVYSFSSMFCDCGGGDCNVKCKCICDYDIVRYEHSIKDEIYKNGVFIYLQNSIRKNFVNRIIKLDREHIFFKGRKIEKYESYGIDHKHSRNMIHGLIRALHIAFVDHQTFVITPDDIWLLVLQGFAAIQEKTKCIDKQFPSLSGKKTRIVVQRDEFVMGGNSNWSNVFPDFMEGIRKNVPEELFKLMCKRFSTTSQLQKTTFAITIMDTVKDFFNYVVYTKCGIPSVYVVGEKKDYVKIIGSLLNMCKYKKLGLNKWIDGIMPIMQKFIDLFENQYDKEFWSSIYKHENVSGGEIISGWITKFFPGVKNTLSITKIPYGISYAPFVWNYLGKEYDMGFYSGFFGCKLVKIENKNAIASGMGWAVCYSQDNPRKVLEGKEHDS